MARQRFCPNRTSHLFRLHRRQYRSVKDDLDAVDAVTIDEIAKVLGRFPLSQSTTVTVGPAEKIDVPK